MRPILREGGGTRPSWQYGKIIPRLFSSDEIELRGASRPRLADFFATRARKVASRTGIANSIFPTG